VLHVRTGAQSARQAARQHTKGRRVGYTRAFIPQFPELNPTILCNTLQNHPAAGFAGGDADADDWQHPDLPPPRWRLFAGAGRLCVMTRSFLAGARRILLPVASRPALWHNWTLRSTRHVISLYFIVARPARSVQEAFVLFVHCLHVHIIRLPVERINPLIDASVPCLTLCMSFSCEFSSRKCLADALNLSDSAPTGVYYSISKNHSTVTFDVNVARITEKDRIDDGWQSTSSF